MVREASEAEPGGAEFARMLAWLLPGLPPDEQNQIGRTLIREAGDTYAARRVPPPRWILDAAGRVGEPPDRVEVG